MNSVLKWVLISVLFLLGVTILSAMILPLIVRFPESGEESAQLAELAAIQTSIQAMMVDNDLSSVRGSTSGLGGEKIRSTGTQFHATLHLQNYIRQLATTYCYTWGTDGRITYQYDVDDNGGCSIDAEQLFP